MRRLLSLLLLVTLPACGNTTATSALPTAHLLPRSAPTSTIYPTSTPAPSPVPPTSTPISRPTAISFATPLDQYRAWIEEARAIHPYSEPVDAMWATMLCESSGNPDAVGAGTYGLFQYTGATWAGDWNPYRDQPILDPRAQIFATAKAWSDGYQGWWSCYTA